MILFSFIKEQSHYLCSLLHYFLLLSKFCPSNLSNFSSIMDPCGFQVVPINIHCQQWHLAKESRTQLKFKVNHIKKQNLDEFQLHPQFQVASKLPQIAQQLGFQQESDCISIQYAFHMLFVQIFCYANVMHAQFYQLIITQGRQASHLSLHPLRRRNQHYHSISENSLKFYDFSFLYQILQTVLDLVCSPRQVC